MDVIPSEMFRGHLDTIILLSLVDEDKHTNQIREEIEKRSDGQFELKQGTFYSCLQRIVKQGYVTEYRASTPEGRRKFLQLTEKGKNYIDDNKDKWAVSRSIVNTLFDTPEKDKKKTIEKPKNTHQKQPDATPDFDIDSALRDFLNSDDTSKVEESKKEVKTEEKPAEPEKIISNNVTIIDFGDIASHKTQNSKPVEESKIEKSEVKTAYKPTETITKTAHQIGIDDYEYSNTPEGYEIGILVGDGVSSNQKQQKSGGVLDQVSEAPTTPNKSSEAANKSERNLAEETQQTKDRLVSQYPDPLTQPKPDFTPVYDESEDDSFGPETVITHDYKAVLESMFTKDKPKVEDAREIVYIQGTNIHDYFNDVDSQEKRNLERQEEQKRNAMQQQRLRVHDKSKTAVPHQESTEPEKTEPQVSVVTSDGYDFSDVQSLAKIEGFKVNISSRNTKNRVNSILINKLVTVSAWIFYAFCIAQITLLAYFTAPAAGLTGTPYLIFASILALFPLGTLVIYFLDPKKKVGTIPTLKSVIELCIVIMLNLVLITIVFSILSEVDFANVSELLIYILYPAIFILNVPVYFIIKYLNLENQRFYS